MRARRQQARRTAIGFAVVALVVAGIAYAAAYYFEIGIAGTLMLAPLAGLFSGALCDTGGGTSTPTFPIEQDESDTVIGHLWLTTPLYLLAILYDPRLAIIIMFSVAGVMVETIMIFRRNLRAGGLS